jgi:isochorismate pyruvate lyase
MSTVIECPSIEEVRTYIDRIDRKIVACLAERGEYVKQAARFKKSANDVKAPRRVEQVIDRVTAFSREVGGNPVVTEHVYRAMIAAFIDAEQVEHEALVDTAGQAVVTARQVAR